MKKRCKDVHARFRTKIEERGSPWGCLDVADALPGLKGRGSLEWVANLRHWQLRNPNKTSMHLPNLPLPGTKLANEWLSISEQNSGSIAHVDVGLATWVPLPGWQENRLASKSFYRGPAGLGELGYQ